MDPFAHTFAGAALAASGLRKATPLATAALIIGANAPDIDVVTVFQDTYLSLAYRRGWTHGILAWVVLPFVVTGLLVFWDRVVRKKNLPAAAPTEYRLLLLMSTIGVLSHPALDWLNNYGIRLLMPFDGRWFYGDALFIIDPWLWLGLGGVAFLVWSHNRFTIATWSLFWLTSTWLVMTNTLVPDGARGLWLAGIAILIACRIRFPRLTTSPRYERIASLCVALVVIYIVGNSLASLSARSQVRELLSEQGYKPIHSVMVDPVPTNPFVGQVIVDTAESYLFGSWHWLNPAHLALSPIRVDKNLGHPAAIAATANQNVRHFLSWSRFPYAEIKPTDSGYQVRFLDARYAGMTRGINGPLVDVSLP